MNTKLWDEVCETNPNDTKHVGQRGGFTAIDAYSQIHRATEVFGSIGIGWGYAVDWDYNIPGVVTADLNFWYLLGKTRGEFQVSGACGLTGKPSVDSDAKKKALTDGITKALSYLGFNADVFLGKFDDNKYLAEVTEKYREHLQTIEQWVDVLNRADNQEKLHELFGSAWMDHKNNESGQATLKEVYDLRKSFFEDKK